MEIGLTLVVVFTCVRFRVCSCPRYVLVWGKVCVCVVRTISQEITNEPAGVNCFSLNPIVRVSAPVVLNDIELRLNVNAGEELMGNKRMFVIGRAEIEMVKKLSCPDATVFW